MSPIKQSVNRVRQLLSYHFANPGGTWNIPKGMPFMKEFLNEIRNLCDLCEKNGERETEDTPTPKRTNENILKPKP